MKYAVKILNITTSKLLIPVMKYKANPSNQEIASLFFLIGEAVWTIQLLESLLSDSNTLKKDVKHPKNFSKQEAEEFRKNNREATFGKAIKKAKENDFDFESFSKDLEALNAERNWLIHKLINQNYDDMFEAVSREKLFVRIKAISTKAIMLQKIIGTDLMEFSESVGVDMANV